MAMWHRLIKNQQVLALLAVIAALIYCSALTTMGLAKFSGIFNGGENYHDFPTAGLSLLRLIINLPLVGLLALYGVWLIQKQSVPSDWNNIVKAAAVFLFLAFLGYPYTSDPYLYLQYGWMGWHGVNPYLTPAADFSSLLSPFHHWPQTSTYGPISQLFFMAAAAFVPISPVVGIYAFKVFCLLFHLFNGYLIWRLLRTSEHRNKLTLAYLINPALLNEQVCNAHIDVFLTTALIVMIGGLYYRQYTIALLAAVTGFLTKTLPLIWLPLIVGFLIRRKQWQPLMLAASITCVVIGGFSLAVFPNFAAWRSLINPGVSGMLARSLYHAIDLLINNFLGLPTSIRQLLINPLIRLGYLVFLFYYVWVLTQPFVKARYSETKLVIDIGWVTLVLFLVATPWLMPWHTTILLPIACLSLNAPLFFVTSFVFGLSPQMVVGTGSGGSSLSLLTSFLTIGPAIAVLWLGIKFPQLRQKFDFLNSG